MDEDERDIVDISTDDSVGIDESRPKTKQERMAEQNREMLTQRISALDYTIKRIEEADEDDMLMQQLEGSVIVEIPPERRDEMKEKLIRTRAELERQREEAKQVLTGN